MVPITPMQAASLRSWFLPDRPGPLIGLHVIQTGNGACFADRWPDPRSVLVETGGNYSLLGDPSVLEPADLTPRIESLVDAPERFAPLVESTFPTAAKWDRVMLVVRNL